MDGGTGYVVLCRVQYVAGRARSVGGGVGSGVGSHRVGCDGYGGGGCEGRGWVWWGRVAYI